MSRNLMIYDRYGSVEQIMTLPASRLIELLRDPSSSVDARAKACQRLAVVGDSAAVPALAPLLAHPQLSMYARFALEPMRGRAAGDALLDAASKLTGVLLIGVINSLGQRRDKQSISALEKLRLHEDVAIVRAAEAALGCIRPAREPLLPPSSS